MYQARDFWATVRNAVSRILITDKQYFKQAILSLFFVAIIAGLTLGEIRPGRLIAGSPSTMTIKAPKTISYVDTEKTDELRKQHSDEVEPVYRLDVKITQDITDKVTRFFVAVSNSADNDEKTAVQGVINEIGDRIDENTIKNSLKIKPERLPIIRVEASRLVQQVYSNRIKREDVSTVKKDLSLMIDKSQAIDDVESKVITGLLEGFIKPNYTLDEEATQMARTKAASQVVPVINRKVAGETIIRDGELVTGQQARIIKQLKIVDNPLSMLKVAGIVFLSILITVLLVAYLYIFQRRVFDSARLMFLLYSNIVLITLIARLFLPKISNYMIPVQTVAILTTMIFSADLAFFSVIICSVLITALSGYPGYLAYATLTGFSAILISNFISDRPKMVVSGLYISIASGLIAFILNIFSGQSLFNSMNFSAWASVGGIFSAILAIGLLAFIEPAFQITTDLRLLDLANPNSVLLKELMMKAPGTYNHSVLVGNMAESAASVLGANPLLARVGAYYHDIGKMKRPYFFIENNFDQRKYHDTINPNLSYMVIKSHVTEGVELAKKHKIPREIIDIIEQHHGTSVVNYFYEQAKKSQVKQKVNEGDFRYPGKKPQTREAAIVMLADASEAAARSIAKPSTNRFKQITKKIIDSKLKDGQLDDCDLTLGDLQSIIECFSSMLNSIYHSRIEYPEAKQEGPATIKEIGKLIPFELKDLKNN